MNRLTLDAVNLGGHGSLRPLLKTSRPALVHVQQHGNAKDLFTRDAPPNQRRTCRCTVTPPSKNARTLSHDPQCKLNGAPRENHDRSHSSAGFVTVLLRAMLSQVFLCSTRSWFSLRGSRVFSPWLSCLTVRLVLEQLAMESALANSVMFSEVSVGDAVAAAPSNGQHVYEIASEEIPMMPFGR